MPPPGPGPRPRDVVILGSTGSIGTQALDVVRAAPDRFRVVGLLEEQMGEEHRPLRMPAAHRHEIVDVLGEPGPARPHQALLDPVGELRRRQRAELARVGVVADGDQHAQWKHRQAVDRPPVEVGEVAHLRHD